MFVGTWSLFESCLFVYLDSFAKCRNLRYRSWSVHWTNTEHFLGLGVLILNKTKSLFCAYTVMRKDKQISHDPYARAQCCGTARVLGGTMGNCWNPLSDKRTFGQCSGEDEAATWASFGRKHPLKNSGRHRSHRQDISGDWWTPLAGAESAGRVR